MRISNTYKKSENPWIEDNVTASPLLEINNLSLTLRRYRKGLRESAIQVLSRVDLKIHEGEVVAIVGASGSGKSLLTNAVLGILPEHATLNGTLHYKGEALTKKKQIRLRGKEISLIPQSVNALDPLMKSGKQVQAVIKKKEKKAIQQDIFQKVGLTSEVGNLYPFELSGGMARRVLATTAMVSEAKLVIADEPTPGLDGGSLNEIVHLIKQLKNKGKGIMFITHDISTALRVADRIAVFYAGQTIEMASVRDFIGKGEKLRHPYTKALWNALPQNDFVPLEGMQPLAGEVQNGCVFAPRCPIAIEQCKTNEPPLKKVTGGLVRCFHA